MAVAGIAAAASLACPATSEAQQKAAAPAAGKGEQFFPVLVYRTGAYAPNGTPWANGYVDYLKLVNAQGGINGVKITWEECETGYATDRGVECYERLKTKPFVSAVQPLSTGITFALTDKAPTDKIPLITAGYGRSESVEGEAFPWNFPLMGTYWDAADVLVQHVGKLNGGVDKLKGKKIALVYHDSPYGKEPIALLQERAKLHGFELMTIPVTHPGVEQKAAWLQIRQNRPDYVFLWGWGVMNSTALARGRGHRVPARQDVRRVVGRGRAGCDAGRCRRQGLQRTGAAARRWSRQGARRHPQARCMQGAGNRSAGRSRHGPVHAGHDQRDAAGRRRAPGTTALRQQAADRRAGPLRTGEPEPRRQADRSPRAGRSDEAARDELPRP